MLRILNRFNLGGPTYNVTFLTAYLPDEYETILCGGKHEEGEGDSIFICEKYGVKPIIIDSLQRSINPLKDRKARKEIRKIIQEFKPHIVHTHASKAGALGRSAAIKEKVPIIVHTFHGHVFHSYFGKAKTWLYKFAERKLAQKTDAIIAISEKQKIELSTIHRIAESEKFKVIPLGFDLSQFNENRTEKRINFREKYNLSSDTIAIGIIGRLTAIKNHDLFINSLFQLKNKTQKKIKAFIIGDGERRGELENLVASFNSSNFIDSIVFTSWIKDLYNILPGLDIVALTSFNEGTPVSLIEAQAAGVPVVTTNVGGVSDVISEGKTGLILKGFEEEELTQNLLKLVEDEEFRLKMSQNGWNFVEQKFNYTRLCSDMNILYRELLKKKNIHANR